MGIIRFLKNQIRHDRNMKRILSEQSVSIKRIQTLLIDQKIQHFRETALAARERGISNERLCEHEVVVSLTTFGKRIFDVPLAIESIMQGTIKPNRIVLWLSEEEYKGKPLPKLLEMQKARGLQIEFCQDLRSYKKLIPSLRLFPDTCIITIDDDAIYGSDLVERLVFTHRSKPDSICASRIHKVRLSKDGRPVSYLNWDHCVESFGNSNLLFPTTGGGTLFPPGCFSQEVFNQEVFMDICPYADDIWFYAMRLMNNIPVAQVYTGKPDGYYIALPSEGLDALSTQNTDEENCRNDSQLEAVFDKYGLYGLLTAEK